MTRAKHRAGIPLTEPVKPKKAPRPATPVTKPIRKEMDINFRKPAGKTKK